MKLLKLCFPKSLYGVSANAENGFITTTSKKTQKKTNTFCSLLNRSSRGQLSICGK